MFFSDRCQWSGDAPFIVGAQGPQGKMTAINSYCGTILGNRAGARSATSASARNAADTQANEATETYRNWLEPHQTPSGQIHPTVTLANDLKPKYFFWNGYSTGVRLLDEVSPDPVTGRYTTSRPVGAIHEATSALFPFKVKAANYPLATRVGQLVPLDTSVYFATGDAQAATVSGLVNMGLSPTEPTAFVETDTCELITHEVRPEEQALQCSNCHGTTNQMDLKGELGYALKGPQSAVCVQCHGSKGSKGFTEMHNKHAKDTKYDCSWCHSFARPERELRMP